MITESQYQEAKRVVAEWLDAQPQDSRYPYKPKYMTVEDYVRKRALNEILKLFITRDSVSFDEFGAILDRFDLAIFKGHNERNKEVVFVRWSERFNVFTGEKVKNDYKEITMVVNKLRDNDY